ncbi:MAG: helix-turn-helix transcriptional regulator [Bacteroidota bacterium]
MEESSRKALGKRLYDTRKPTGMTQQEVGQILGVSRSYYAGFESGSKKISIELLILFAEKMGVDFEWLTHGEADDTNGNIDGNTDGNIEHNVLKPTESGHSTDSLGSLREVIRAKNALIDSLKRENETLRDMIELLKKNS